MPTMNTTRSFLTALALVLATALTLSASAQQGSYEERENDTLLEADLDGENEIDLGDDDGSGEAWIAIREDHSELCWRLEVNDVDQANAAHIHEGQEGEDGPPVVTLSVDSNTTSEGCAPDAGDGVLQRIAENPSDFYVNVHNAEHPNGAIRGQLTEQEEIIDDDVFGDDGDQGDQTGDGVGDDGTDADPQEGTDADTPAPGLALVLAAIGLAAAVVVARRR